MKPKKILEQNDEIRDLRAAVKSYESLVSEYQRQIEDARRAKFTIPKGRRARSSKADYLRVVFGDAHGCYLDKAAAAALLADLEKLKPREVVFLGDMLDCSGFLATHHVLNFTTQALYTFEKDVAATNDFISRVQAATPGARFHYLEGNHENRIERHLCTWALKSGAPDPHREAEHMRALYDPVVVLDLESRNIPYYRLSETFDGDDGPLSLPSVIKLGKCHFFHGVGVASGANPAKKVLERFSANCVFGHVHRIDSHTTRTLGGGVKSAWCPGALCELQPLYATARSGLTSWAHGYGLQLVRGSTGDFLHINVPIIKGVSFLHSLADRLS